MTTSLHRRVERMKSRAAVRAWDYRQRHHAKGAWYRWRRLLAGSSRAFALTEEAARVLIGEGFVPQPEGSLLEPPRTVLCVPAARLEGVDGKREIDVRLSAELLAECWLALVPF